MTAPQSTHPSGRWKPPESILNILLMLALELAVPAAVKYYKSKFELISDLNHVDGWIPGLVRDCQ